MYEPWIAVLLGQRDALQVLAMLEAYIVYLGMRDGWFGRANVIGNFGLENYLGFEAFVTFGFRLHVVVLNDPIRRSVVHLCYSWLGAGWAVSMVGYVSTEFDPTDPVFNPMWRQGMFVLPFMVRLGVLRSR